MAGYAMRASMRGFDAVTSSDAEDRVFQCSSCDVGTDSLQLLQRLARASSMCVFKNIASVVQGYDRLRLPAPTASRSRKVIVYQQLHDTLCSRSNHYFPTMLRATCRTHDRACIVSPRAALCAASTVPSVSPWYSRPEVQAIKKSALCIAHGSTICSGWSPLSRQRAGLGHDSELSHAVFIGERRAREEQGLTVLVFHKKK